MKTTFLFALICTLCFSTSPAEAQTAGTLDLNYKPAISDGFSMFPSASTMSPQPDGRVWVAGNVNYAYRFSVDATSRYSVTAGFGVGSIAIQFDGKILLGGAFTQINGSSRNRIARLNANGTLESTATFNAGTGANDVVARVAVQADGKILLAGSFTMVNGLPRNRLARLNADGTLESTATFNPGTGPNGSVDCVALQADGKILIGGNFTTVNGATRSRIARLNADGSLESTTTFSAGFSNFLNCITVLPDGKILIGGYFPTRIARLNPDGSAESTATFNPGTGPDGGLTGMTVQADGKILIAGIFLSVNGLPRNNFARLNANGSVESNATFDYGTGPNGNVYSVALQADGKILVGGTFTGFSGTAQKYLVRLSNDPKTQNLTALDATRIQWLRGGSSPEVYQVRFDLSTDGGSSWSVLGAGTRITGGWQLTGLSLPGSGLLRVRGFTLGGARNSSSGLIETITTFPTTPIQPWKFAHLGDNTASDFDDPDGDGLKTLSEYGLGLPPEIPSQPPGASIFTYLEGDRLRMFVPRDPAHNDVSVSIEATSDLAAWTTLATSTLGAPFSGPGYVGGDDPTPGVKTVEVRDIVNISSTTQRWLRVKVMH